MTYVALKAVIEKERPDWIWALIPRKKLDPTFGTVEAQMGHLLEYEVPTFYVSKELLAAAAQTDLPAELLLDAVPFPFPALVFMLPKGTIRHPIEGDRPYVVVSCTEQGQVTSLPLKDIIGL